MDDGYLTDQQQADRVTGWFRENGLFLVAGVVLGLGGLFGWNQWQQYQERRALEASALYEQLMQSVVDQKFDEAETQLRQLVDDFGGTPYVDQGRLALARVNVDRNNPDRAALYLKQVVDAAASPEFRNIARLRLARVLTFQEKYADALKVLADPGSKAFAPAFHDVRGDVYYAMGKPAEARSEYEQALNGETAARVIDRSYVQAKLDELGGPTAALAAAPGGPAPAGAAVSDAPPPPANAPPAK